LDRIRVAARRVAEGRGHIKRPRGRVRTGPAGAAAAPSRPLPETRFREMHRVVRAITRGGTRETRWSDTELTQCATSCGCISATTGRSC
jgi:hypothetical protein